MKGSTGWSMERGSFWYKALQPTVTWVAEDDPQVTPMDWLKGRTPEKKESGPSRVHRGDGWHSFYLCGPSEQQQQQQQCNFQISVGPPAPKLWSKHFQTSGLGAWLGTDCLEPRSTSTGPPSQSVRQDTRESTSCLQLLPGPVWVCTSEKRRWHPREGKPQIFRVNGGDGMEGKPIPVPY